jgi:hypothetical protein
MQLGDFYGQAAADYSSVTASVGSITILAANPHRIRALFFNHGSADMFLKFGDGSSISNFNVKLSSGSYYETPMPCYTGSFTATWGAANGSVKITEFGVK